MDFIVSKYLICMAALLLKMSAVCLISFAESTSAFADKTFDSILIQSYQLTFSP